MYKELRPILLPLILGRDETAGSVGQNDEDGNDGDDKWAGWREMSNKEGSDGGNDDASEDIAEVEGGSRNYQAIATRIK